jgi:GH25 family lysozyme M1 (1,4-beta-N-acetylmuramidase)
MHRRLARLLTPTRGLALVLAALLVPVATGAVDATSTNYASNCGANLRARPSVTSTIRRSVPIDSVVTVVGKVAGGYWQANCATAVHGSSWFRITAINGKSVSSLFGVSAVYAATGLFRQVAAAAALGSGEGIDVSNWQGLIDFSKVKAAGKGFVIAKATEGSTWTDASYARNRAAAMAAGLRFGGYHFARPGSQYGDAVREADHFVAVLGLKRGMLVPTLDLELSGGLSVRGLQAWVKAFLGRVYARTGARAMIYTTTSFWQTYMGNSTWFAANGYRMMWIANWHVASPTTPAANWGGLSWGFWQYSSCGKVAGISGCVDLDRFRGSDFSGVTF